MSDFRDHIAVIDYGMGNLHSVAKALEHVAPSATVTVTSDSQVVENADRVVFPGVGAIRDCMHEIQRLNIGQVVAKAIQTKPVLAICVGMQALMQTSEENGGIDCLKILPGQVKYFGDSLKDTHGNKLKVPHMGWNNVNQSQDHPLWHKIQQDSRFYFVHSYYVQTLNLNRHHSGSSFSRANDEFTIDAQHACSRNTIATVVGVSTHHTQSLARWNHQCPPTLNRQVLHKQVLRGRVIVHICSAIHRHRRP